MSTPRAAAVAAAAAGLVAAGFALPAHAHDFQPGVLAMVETAPGELAVRWTEPVDSQGAPAGVRVVFPPDCRRDEDRLRCGAAGPRGEIVFEGLHDRRMQVVVSLARRDGTVEEHVVTGEAPRLRLGAAGTSFLAWVVLGMEHIALGLDHLAFLIGLLLVAGGAGVRRLLVTVTAFTVAHSLTLALATLGVLAVPSAPVEASIAASVLLVAREGTHDRPTLTRRAPWLVALIFGLVHGLGFAGTLAERGLPSGSVTRALLGFNVGVELAQVALVAVALAGARLVGRAFDDGRRPKLLACYLIGAPAACWLIARTVAIGGAVAGGP
jgi:hypothetical protein